MRILKELIPKNRVTLKKNTLSQLDEQTVFYIATKVLKEEYGFRGAENIIPSFYKEKKLHLASRSSLWGNEVWLERDRLKEKMNNLLGTEAVVEIKIDRG